MTDAATARLQAWKFGGDRLGEVDLTLIIVAAALVSACLALVALVTSQRRTRRQLGALMGRLDELERVATVREPAVPPGPGARQGDAKSESAEGFEPNLSRDVLAGRTSFVRRAVEGELSRPASLAGQVIAVVHSNIEDSLSPAELASQLSVSLRTLERGVAGELGCTPRQLILAMKMREARRLLFSGQYRVNEVATRLGFATASHFSRSFRTFYRVPPSQLVRGSKA